MAKAVDRIKADLTDTVMTIGDLENYMITERFHLKENDEESTEDIIKFTNYSSEIWIYGYQSDGEICITSVNPVTRLESEPTKVDPFHSYEDLEKIQNYFKERGLIHHWLVGWLMVAEGRRVGDTMNLKWSDFFNKNIVYRKRLTQLKEEKTGKVVAPIINAVAKNAIDEYIKACHISVRKVYNEPIFSCVPATFRKALKMAVADVGLDYDVSTHSYRKFYGNTLYKLHPKDANNIKIIQFMFGHSSEEITRGYIGQIDEEIDRYNIDFEKYIIAKQNGEAFEISNSPIVPLRAEDFRDLISKAFDMGSSGADKFETMNEIIGMAEQLVV